MATIPAAAHPNCRSRKKYPEPYRSLAITADALKTMTNPMKIKSKVTVKSQLSTATRFAMGAFHFITEMTSHGDFLEMIRGRI